MDCVIWDLCQTLFDTRHRLHNILENPPDWKAYDSLMHEDTLIEGAAIVYRALALAGRPQIIITGRGERTREACFKIMTKHRLAYEEMFMRSEGDRRPSDQVKTDLLAQARKAGWHPILAFEDHPATVAMYRNSGIEVFAADDFSWNSGLFREVRRFKGD